MSDDAPMFVGSGGAPRIREVTGREPEEWRPHEDSAGERKAKSGDHPAGYIAHADLVAAVNTALVLGKPLLLAGNPGTGKSQLAERVAWELGLSPVLRFEAQSISEAQDLFYRFDLVGQLARVQLQKSEVPGVDRGPIRPIDFVTFGPLGRAILRAARLPARDIDKGGALERRLSLLRHAFPSDKILDSWTPRRSVVLIDEIDKASRDFPNDLLNAIERLEFRIRELPEGEGNLIRVSDDEEFRPIVIITSNGEREIPAPFLRRCVFCHIPDPDRDTLRSIVRNRVLDGQGSAGLPTLYEELLGFFDGFRGDDQSFAYRPGTAELVDWSRAISRYRGADASAGLHANRRLVLETASAVAKNQKDRERLLELFEAWAPTPLAAEKQ